MNQVVAEVLGKLIHLEDCSFFLNFLFLGAFL